MKSTTIDLTQNPDLKDLVADMEVGDNLILYASIKEKDDQNLVITINESEEGDAHKSDDTEEENPEEDAAEEGESEKPKPMGNRKALGGFDY